MSAPHEGLFTSLLAHTSDHVYFKDLESRFIQVSASLADRYELGTPAAAVGQTDADIFADEHARQARADELRIIRTGKPIIGKEEKETWPNGRVTWVTTSKWPLRDAAGAVLGTFGISRDITEQKLAEQRANRYARELAEQKRQIEADLMMARELQETFLPQRYPTFPKTSAPKDSALRFAHRYQPSSQLGGDFFDVFALSDTRAGVFICDVMGHGVRAALITAMVRTLVESLREQAGDPGRFLTEINQALLTALRQTPLTLFATAFYATIDVATGALECASAGHPHPILLRRGAAQVEQLRLPASAHGPALAVFEKTVYTSHTLPVETNDTLLLFTDGLYEVENAADEDFGQPRLVEALHRRLQMPTLQLFDDLLYEIRRYSTGREFRDDVCLLGVDVRRSAP